MISSPNLSRECVGSLWGGGGGSGCVRGEGPLEEKWTFANEQLVFFRSMHTRN